MDVSLSGRKETLTMAGAKRDGNRPLVISKDVMWKLLYQQIHADGGGRGRDRSTTPRGPTTEAEEEIPGTVVQKGT